MASFLAHGTNHGHIAAPKYDPFEVGSVSGSKGSVLHDRGLLKALEAEYKPNGLIAGDPVCTVFVGRIDPLTTEETLHNLFSAFGGIKRLRVVRSILTGLSRRYAFVEYHNERDAQKAYQKAHRSVVDGQEILVDWEHERLVSGWKPRRLGGGFGGKKESGQVRFGCRASPWKKPSQSHRTGKRSVAGHGNR